MQLYYNYKSSLSDIKAIVKSHELVKLPIAYTKAKKYEQGIQESSK